MPQADYSRSAAKLHESEVWRTTPTDLGGWANRATALLQERDYLLEVLQRLSDDFRWLLDEHPEHKGDYSENRLDEVERALS